MRKYNFILRIILIFLTKPLFGMDAYFEGLEITTTTRSSLSNMSLDHKTQIHTVLPQMIVGGMDTWQKSKIIEICKLILACSLPLDNFANLFQEKIQNTQDIIKYSTIIDEVYTAAKAYWESIFYAG